MFVSNGQELELHSKSKAAEARSNHCRFHRFAGWLDAEGSRKEMGYGG